MWLQNLLINVFEPILFRLIDKRLSILEERIDKYFSQIRRFEAYALESEQLIVAAAKATTSEERWAHVQRLKNSRASLPVN